MCVSMYWASDSSGRGHIGQDCSHQHNCPVCCAFGGHAQIVTWRAGANWRAPSWRGFWKCHQKNIRQQQPYCGDRAGPGTGATVVESLLRPRDCRFDRYCLSIVNKIRPNFIVYHHKHYHYLKHDLRKGGIVVPAIVHLSYRSIAWPRQRTYSRVLQ